MKPSLHASGCVNSGQIVCELNLRIHHRGDGIAYVFLSVKYLSSHLRNIVFEDRVADPSATSELKHANYAPSTASARATYEQSVLARKPVHHRDDEKSRFCVLRAKKLYEETVSQNAAEYLDDSSWYMVLSVATGQAGQIFVAASAYLEVCVLSCRAKHTVIAQKGSLLK